MGFIVFDRSNLAALLRLPHLQMFVSLSDLHVVLVIHVVMWCVLIGVKVCCWMLNVHAC